MKTKLPLILIAFLFSCSVRESERALAPKVSESAKIAYNGPKEKVVIGEFANRTPYSIGVFSNGSKELETKAKQALITHLTQSQRFTVLDRLNSELASGEAKLMGSKQYRKGAGLIITGAVTQLGRQEKGSQALGGLIQRSRVQVVRAQVELSLVDTTTQEIKGAYQGTGEIELAAKEVLGFGSTMGYDSTQNDKAVDLAIREAVDKLVAQR